MKVSDSGSKKKAVDWLLDVMERGKFWSKEDQTYLVHLRCQECQVVFEELYSSAIEIVLAGSSPACIVCLEKLNMGGR